MSSSGSTSARSSSSETLRSARLSSLLSRSISANSNAAGANAGLVFSFSGLSAATSRPSAIPLRSERNRIDRPVFDLAAHFGVETGIAAGKNLQGGEHRVGRIKNRHDRNRARRAQRRPCLLYTSDAADEE